MLASTSQNTSNFVKADSRNLPRVDNVMILEYMALSNKHNVAEIRGAKALMSSRDSYLNSAVGYVEISRSVKIVPEHRIHNKLYTVTAKVNETNDIITDTNCEDCAASAGGCKHSLLLLFWLAKKSDQPSSSSVECYWAKPKLSSARTELLNSKDTFKNPKKIKLAPKDPSLLLEFQKECERRCIKESLITNFSKKPNDNNVNIFDMTIEFVEKETNHGFNFYKEYMDQKITDNIKTEISNKTVNQAKSKLWHYVRQGRITASKLYEAAACKTHGSLVQQILGGYKVPDNEAMKRGRKLEEAVLKKIEEKLKIKVEKVGFLLINSILGASPDGLTKDFVVEIKCPTSKKTFETYIKNGKIQNKFKAQINCQMIAASKKKGLFCVADPLFEETEEIHIYWINLEEIYLNDLIKKATNFWNIFVYPKILASAKE